MLALGPLVRRLCCREEGRETWSQSLADRVRFPRGTRAPSCSALWCLECCWHLRSGAGRPGRGDSCTLGSGSCHCAADGVLVSWLRQDLRGDVLLLVVSL